MKLLHPIITYFLSMDLTYFSFGTFIGVGFKPVLGAYLTKSSSISGTSNILMGFLGSVIISFFEYFVRKLVKWHATDIFLVVVA
eukprot:Gb_20273 [translate_table: standard]